MVWRSVPTWLFSLVTADSKQIIYEHKYPRGPSGNVIYFKRRYFCLFVRIRGRDSAMRSFYHRRCSPQRGNPPSFGLSAVNSSNLPTLLRRFSLLMTFLNILVVVSATGQARRVNWKIWRAFFATHLNFNSRTGHAKYFTC